MNAAVRQVGFSQVPHHHDLPAVKLQEVGRSNYFNEPRIPKNEETFCFEAHHVEQCSNSIFLDAATLRVQVLLYYPKTNLPTVNKHESYFAAFAASSRGVFPGDAKGCESVMS